jgi:hypothetical protein
MNRYQIAIYSMNVQTKARTLATLVLLTVATGASARLYKFVGADGSVTYADHPPTSPTPNVQVFSAGIPRAVAADERGYLALRKPPPAEAPHHPAPVAAQASAAPLPPPPDIRVERLAALLPAMRMATDTTTLIDRSVDLCILSMPQSFRRYIGAQDAWKTRNAGVTRRLNAVLSDIASGDDRLRLEQEALERSSARLHAVRTLAPAQRATWCDKTAADIDAGKLDLAGMAGMRPLLQFEAR